MRIVSAGFAVAMLSLLCAVSRTNAEEVSGVLAVSSGPVAGRELHFENQATRDVFMAPSSGTGAFSADLPPGIYDLRGERGKVYLRDIIVSDAPIELGTINHPSGFNPMWLFQMEGVQNVLVNTPAPGTADLMRTGQTGIDSNLPIPPVTGEWSQKGGAGALPQQTNPATPPVSSLDPAAPAPNASAVKTPDVSSLTPAPLPK
ncbi:MAG: hypothetical protein IVW54_09100 [Candidatus Binataceae bacterium]|nr:hypothetical protein [Candidatus Binataceae bacterium]